MSKILPTVRATCVGLLVLGLTACVHISNPGMPADWPALRPLATVSGLEGTYRGDRRQCSQFSQAFFPREALAVQAADGYRLTTVPDGLQVEALAGETVLRTRVIPVQLTAGAVTFEHKESGHEGLAAASYSFRTTLQINAAGELVAAYHYSSFGVVFPVPGGSSTTEWWRLPSSAR